jgi:hypothetical protein
MDRFLLHAKSAFPTSLWVMQEVEQRMEQLPRHEEHEEIKLRALRVFVVNLLQQGNYAKTLPNGVVCYSANYRIGQKIKIQIFA